MKTLTPYPNLSRLTWEQRLTLYGLAAGAAVAAGASSAQANLITLDLSGLPLGDRTETFIPTDTKVYFDVNAASAAAAVSNSPFPAADFVLSDLSVNGIGANGVQGHPLLVSFFQKASRLTSSNFVGPAGNFAHQGSVDAGNPSWGTPLAGPVTGFVGLKFQIGSDFHFGWAEITNTNSTRTITLDALGYESNPNTPAHVGFSAAVPDHGSTLILLAMGATGVIAFRARQGKTV